METSWAKQVKRVESSHIKSALVLLKQAAELASEVDRDPWDFAIEIGTLRAEGVSNSDLRWMICKGIVKHGFEVTEALETSRRFYANTELAFSHDSCFVLTPAGERFASQVVTASNGAAGAVRRTPGGVGGGHPQAVLGGHVEQPEEITCPTWDGLRHQLRVGTVIVKEYKLPSPNQEAILAAFEEEGWPPCIDDPLTVDPELDPKRRLHDTVKSLNRNQRNRLVRFMGNGTGEGVRWEWIENKDGK